MSNDSSALTKTVSYRETEERWNELKLEAEQAGLKGVSEYARRRMNEKPSDSMRAIILKIEARSLTTNAILNFLLEIAGFNPEDDEQMEELAKHINQNKLDIIESENSGGEA